MDEWAAQPQTGFFCIVPALGTCLQFCCSGLPIDRYGNCIDVRICPVFNVFVLYKISHCIGLNR